MQVRAGQTLDFQLEGMSGVRLIFMSRISSVATGQHVVALVLNVGTISISLTVIATAVSLLK